MNYKKSSKHLGSLLPSSMVPKTIVESRDGELDELIEQEIERMEDDES